jgi:NADH-quinone oxidoreductase subunit H
VSGAALADGLWALTAEALLLLGFLLGVFVPLVAWAERKQAALVAGRPGVGRTALAGVGLAGLLQPLADTLKLLGKRSRTPVRTRRAWHEWAPALIVVATLLAFASIPWSGRYVLNETSFSLVLADVEGGVLYIFALTAMGGLATVWSGAARGGAGTLGAFRSAARSLSGDLALLFSLLPMLLIFGSLRLSEMVQWQDSSFALFALPGALSASGPAAAAAGPIWPAWGIFLNPPAFVLVLTAASVRAGLPPFDAESADAELVGGTRSGYSGASLGLLALAARLQTILVAALLTLIFLGGWAIPWLPQETLVAGITKFIGAGVANAICLGLHVICFGGKLLAVVFLQLMIRSSLPRLSYERAMDLCWKIIVPAALVDLMVTAGILQTLGAATP